jgi:plastocyanin
VKESDLAKLEKDQTVGKKDKTTLTFTENAIRLVATTGPEDDMLSFRIQGMRNPTIVVPSGATLTVLFINTDGDMTHDIRFSHVMGDFPIAPATAESAGTTRIAHKAEDGTSNAEEIVIKANEEDGAYKYFCSVRGHAKGGMWGNILVGVKPGADMKMPEKMDMNNMDHKKSDEMPGMKMDDKKKSEDMSDMPGMKPETSDKSGSDKQGDISGMKGMKMDDNKSKDMSSMPGMANMPGMNHGAMEMRSSVNLAEPMAREGSGTSWVPDSSPMYAYMKMYENGDMLMLHGNMFLRYTHVGSSRDLSVAGKGNHERFDAPSMFMAMYAHPLSKKSQLGLRVMMSLDPIFERGYGYPLLYQSGESYGGQPIHDRQHPHDLFSELSATYSYKFNDKQSFYFYAGYPGEPALGPPAFMHRLSAMDNPDAPIGHHWQDATHITFGVLTAGYVYDKFKFEASAFKGQEPNENRYNFDRPKLDSFSGRISFNPTKEWSFQISHGYLKNPEPAEPDVRIRRRTTASAIYNKNFSDDRNWANSFVWGQNYDGGKDSRTNAFLFETNYQFQKNSVFSRFERVQKSAHELALPAPHPEGNFWVGVLSAGYVRDLVRDKGLDVGLGAQATLYTNPSALTPFYGGTTHGGFQVFLRFRPSRINH